MLNFLTVIVAALATLGTVAPAPAPAPVAAASINARHYANQTPYGDAESSSIKSPPAGYTLAFLETVGRHGARTLTSSAAERRSLKVWADAKNDDALTSTGRSFAADVAAFQKPEQKIGYGNLSAIGTAEWEGIGRRTADNYGGFLQRSTKAGDQVVFKTSPILRTEQSAKAMEMSLKSAVPALDVAPYVTDAVRLLIGNGASAAGNAAVDRIIASPGVIGASRHLLTRLYTQQYVDGLDDPVMAALDVYLLYCTAPGMQGDTDVTFARYVSLADAKAMEYVVDAQNFYHFGPGVEGETSSYQASKPLLDDFFAELDKRLSGGSTAAVFRLAHGETTMPFAALLRLPGSSQQVPGAGVFTYDDNPWRGYVAGRLGGNIEWAAYRNASRDVVVTMRYNEQPVKFNSSCTAMSPGSYFYRVSELRSCLT
ncbi:histidine-type phosphatase [Aeromicrobium sp.]|uniref:histidine-type phosphatase n=1 Tax=Aeromicrobium sp. TaxID=1871063 RepID=UPI001985FE07|nr:histidine-type phosphatase [Aeromicrobium sp.]MBC7630614.1 histidine-type phosphatase [Aeromicrobium sp.]